MFFLVLQLTSTCAALEHGIPQGSVLSPFLFNIYTDGLTSTTKSCNLESFVDDSKTFITFPVMARNLRHLSLRLTQRSAAYNIMREQHGRQTRERVN